MYSAGRTVVFSRLLPLAALCRGLICCACVHASCRELEEAYEAAKADPAFHEEVAWYRREYIGGPTPMYHAKRLTEEMGGAQVGCGCCVSLVVI